MTVPLGLYDFSNEHERIRNICHASPAFLPEAFKPRITRYTPASS